MAYRIGMDDEEKKRQNLVTENQAFREKYTSGGALSQGTVKVRVDLSQYQPQDIAELGYRMPKEQRGQFLDFAQNYYKQAGAANIPKADDVSAQWDEWDATRESALGRIAIEQKESALGITGMNKMSALSTIAGMADGDEKTAAQNAYADLTTTQGSKYYTAYAKATSAPLATLGVESVDDAWFEKTRGLEQYLLRDANTGKIEKPGNSATEQQKQAYARHLLLENEETTKTAEAEMASLYDAIAAEAQYTGFDPKTFIDEIDWTEYPTLKKMMDGAYTGEYVQLNRAVPMSTEAMYGMAYCAMNGITPTDAREYEMYAGAYVNDLKKQATLGTDEEEPEGFLEGVWDAVSGEKKDRQQRIAQGEAAQKRLEELGVKYTAPGEKPVLPDWVGKRESATDQTPDEQEVYQPEELIEPGTFIKPRTREDDIKEFQAGGYTFVESAQDRNTLRRIDEQIELIKTEQEAVKAQRVANGKSATDERLTELDVQLGKLSAKKIRIAFGGSGETIANTNVTMKRKVAPGRTAGLEITPESADELSDRYEQNIQQKAQQEEPESQNMQTPVGHGTTAWQMWYSASTDETEAMYADYERKMAEARAMEDADARLDALLEAEDVFTEGIYAMQVRAKVLEGLIPTDEATAALHEAAGTERISMLCEREVASALGEDDRVEEINNALIEAGYPVCWPEEEEVIAQERAQSIEYAKGWGDDTVRERLGITDGRELTDEDYYQAAHTDKGFWDWAMWGAISEENKENAQASMRALGAAEKSGPVQLDAETTEGVLQGYAEAVVGKDASIEQAEAVKDAVAVPLAITGGAIRGVTGSIEGVAAMAEAFAFEAARAQYGHNLTRAQMEILSPGYKLVADAKTELDKDIQTVTPDVSQRSGWVQTIGSLSETVIQNAAMAQAGSIVGKTNLTFAKMLGIKKAETLAKVYRTSSNLTRNMGFTLSGFKSGMAEAQALGLDNEEAINYAVLTAGISMGVENISIDPLTDAARVLNKIPDGKSAAKKGVRILAQMGKSALGEAVEEAVESPAQNFKRWLLADPDMAWIGEGGVIDPGEMLRSAAMGGAAGAILGAAGAQVETRTQKSEAQGNVRNAADTGANEADTGETIERAEGTTEQSTGEVKTVENEAAQGGAEIESTEGAQGEATGQVRTSEGKETKEPGEGENETQTPEMDMNALEELIANEGVEKIRMDVARQDIACALMAMGSSYTSAETKMIAEKAYDAIMNNQAPMTATERTALWQSVAKDIAKAQASAPVQEAEIELKKAQEGVREVEKEYRQMQGRFDALMDNASQIISQMLTGTATKELQGRYETALNKTNSLQKRLENQKARMRDAKERERTAQSTMNAAQTQAKADEAAIYTQMEAEAQSAATPQAEQAEMTPQDAEAQIDRATAQEIANGNNSGAMELQKGKARVKIAVQNPSMESAMPGAKKATREVIDRFEDYDVRGLRKYLAQTPIYVNEQQRAEIKNITGMPHNRAGYKYSIRFTSKKAGATPLDGAAWADISGYLPGILDPNSPHPVNDLLGVLDDMWANDQEKRRGGAVRYMSQRKRTRNEGTGGETPTESGQRIIEKLQKAFPGVTVRARSPIGNIDDSGGYANVQTGGARVVGLQNVEDVVHEIGHLLAVKHGGVNEVARSQKGRIEEGGVHVKEEHRAGVDAMVERLMQSEPGTMDQYEDVEDRRQEAISEFWTWWLRGDNAARTLAGEELYEVLTSTADEKQMKALQEAREAYIVLNGATQAKRDEAQFVSERVARERELEAAATQGIRARLTTEVFDENYAARMIDKVSLESTLAGMSKEEIKAARKVARKTGRLMIEENDRIYYRQANLSKATGIVKHWVKDKILDRNGNVLLDTNISKVTSSIKRKERDAFGRYVALYNELDARNLQEKRRQEAEERGEDYRIGPGDYYNLNWANRDKEWVENEIRQSEREHPHFKNVHAGMRQIWTTLMEEFQVKPGYIENAQDAWQKVNEARPNYLPTRAVESSTVREEGRTGTLAKEAREIRRASAGDRDLVQPIETFIAELSRMAHQSAAMEVKNTIARVYDEYEGQGQFFREISAEEVNANAEIYRAISERGEFNMTDVNAKTGQAIIDQGTRPGEQRVMVAIQNGRARYFEIKDQAVYDVIARSETPQEASKEIRKAMAVMRTVNNIFRATTTVLSPFFGIKNMGRDISTGMVFGTQANAGAFLKTYFKSLWESGQYFFGGKLESEALRKFAAMGGLEGDAYGHDVASEREKLQDLFGDEMNAVQMAMHKVKEAVENFNDTIETGMRYAQFQSGLKAGQSVQRAFRMSQEVTTDFSRTGRTAKHAAKYFYFFNASLQGTYDVLHAMEEGDIDPQRATRMVTRSIIHAAAMPLALTLARALRWSDEDKEKYDALAENVKRENFVIGFVGNKAILYPKGQSLIFTIGDAIGRTWADGVMRELRNGNTVGDYFRHEGMEDLQELVWDLVGDVNPIQTSVAQTAIDLAFNRNHWGDEIVPSYMEGWDARNKYDNYTSTIAVALGQVTGAFGISPKAIHYAIDQQMGFVGDLILKMTTPSSAYGESLEESDSIGDWMLTNFAMSPLRLLFDMTTKGFTSDITLVSSVRDDFEEYQSFFTATIGEYEEFDGDRRRMRSKISMNISDRQAKKAYEDAEAMNKYLSKANRAISALYKEMRNNPEETQACQDAIMQIQLVSNQAAESWQRRYMDGDLTVQVKIPKGEW